MANTDDKNVSAKEWRDLIINEIRETRSNINTLNNKFDLIKDDVNTLKSTFNAMSNTLNAHSNHCPLNREAIEKITESTVTNKFLEHDLNQPLKFRTKVLTFLTIISTALVIILSIITITDKTSNQHTHTDKTTIEHDGSHASTVTTIPSN